MVIPQHGRYDEARRAWNLAVDQRPAAIVYPDSAEDVVTAVLFAREHAQRVAAQGTGHGSDPLGPLDDTILIKTERMRGIEIDASARIARVQAGVLWHELSEAAAQHGLAALQGSSPDVGVVGYTLGGGLSFMGRKHGLAASSVHAIELVTAEGTHIRADREHEPDLFWALRGGGGSFGVVTALELRLLPITEIHAGILWYPVSRADEVLGGWRELTAGSPPDELTTVGRILHLPPIPEIPEPVRGKSFVVVEVFHLGDRADADELIRPMRELGPVNDTIETISIPALSHVHMDPEHPVPGAGDGQMLAELPPAAVDAFVGVAGENTRFPLLSVELRYLDGELGRARDENGALAAVDGRYAMYAVGMTPVPELDAPTRAQVSAVKEALMPWAARRSYLNFTDTRQPVETLWTPEAYLRLRKIKAVVDPDDVMRSNHPIPPAR
jgi:FAD/FMN-containing dehydrogenase